MKTNPFSSARGLIAAWRWMRSCAGLIGIAMGCLGALTVTSETAIARRAAWKLVDYHQKACVDISSPYADRTVYFGIWLDGRWAHRLQAGLRNVPVGSTSRSSDLPIVPGSSEGVYALAYVAVQIAPDIPIGSYTFDLWVSDGTTRQRVPLKLVVAETCNGY